MENAQLDNFLKELNNGLADLENVTIFQKVIAESLAVFSLTELLLSEELKTSRPTVNRWKTGATIPHILIREGVYKTLLKRARALAKSIGAGSQSERVKTSSTEGKVAHP